MPSRPCDLRVASGILWTLLLSAPLSVSTGCRSETTPIAEVPDSGFAAKVDALVTRYVELGDFSGVAYVARGDDVLFARAYGEASRELAVPNSIDTAFLIGSISKQFTAAAVLLLQQDGRLTVEDTLERFLPEFPRGDEITLHQLLTHTAGVPDVYELPQFALASTVRASLDDVTEALAGRPLTFEPGSGHAYSNGGYSLLARVIEVAAGRSYPEFISDRVLGPLDLRGSGVLTDEIAVGLATGYDPRGVTGFRPAPRIGPAWLHGSGSVFATAPDLRRWDRALRSDALLDLDSRTAMFTNHGNAYGYGVSIYERHGDTVIEHDGRLAGYAADLARYLDTNAVVILLSNVQSVARDHLRDDIGALLLGQQPAERAPRTVATREVVPQTLDELAGRYGFGPNLTVHVQDDGRSLWLRANAGSESEFFPAADQTFFSRTLYAAVSFARDASGEVTSMSYMPEGARFEGERLD